MKLYGVGVGPGDSKDVTVGVVEILKNSPVIFVPVKKPGFESEAYRVVKEYIKDSEIVKLVFPMNYNKEKLEKQWKENGKIIENKLKEKKTGTIITIGDISLYSTILYIEEILKDKDIDIVLKPGITSYSKIASLLGIPLAKWEEGLAVVPASRDSKFNLENILKNFETVVVMKPSHNPEGIIEALKNNNLQDCFKLVIKAGTEEETIVDNLEELKNGIPYLSTMIIKRAN
jgi:precorrin-2 C(20)-methyltransferase